MTNSSSVSAWNLDESMSSDHVLVTGGAGCGKTARVASSEEQGDQRATGHDQP
jgi:hypothetical protein